MILELILKQVLDAIHSNLYNDLEVNTHYINDVWSIEIRKHLVNKYKMIISLSEWKLCDADDNVLISSTYMFDVYSYDFFEAFHFLHSTY